jgi:teichuronic acid biosynthesis glycosyltransferase TuaC
VKRLLSIATLYPNAHTPRFGTFVARQMEALAARGDWDVTVINPVGTPPFAPQFALGRYAAVAKAAVDGVEHGVTVLRPRFTLIPAVGGPFNPRMICRAVLPLARRLHAAEPFDLVDAQFFYPDGPAAACVARELGLPLAIKARGADISLWGHKPYANRMMRAAANQAAGLLAVSEALADDMAAIGLPRSKIAVHYTGLDHSAFRLLPRGESRARLVELGIPDSGPLIATVGALIPRKGQGFVIEALARLPGTRLALVGKGPDEDVLRALADKLGVAERVHFLGSLDHAMLPLVLSASEAMALPSASEGLANAWVEALACGTPLVITAAGGARELVKDASAGRIVERDSAAIAEAVASLLAAPPDRDAVARAAAPFSWEANAERLAELYSGFIA